MTLFIASFCRRLLLQFLHSFYRSFIHQSSVVNPVKR